MNKNSILTICAALVGSIIILSSIQVSDSVLTYKMLVTVQPEKSPIMEGEFPVIIGTVKDEAYKPVANANVLILFGNEAVTTTTDVAGNYRYQSAIPATPGTYEIDVTA
ncbi:MAG TPA: carboxypeptidase-like regulatory domain-containing protein, partial [Candidatus Bathyarchaeia archaeon]|nr:carboxypeptidase-like regulatory domain-containing protein [Candidatus Bathyarchaeia archaeon]